MKQVFLYLILISAVVVGCKRTQKQQSDKLPAIDSIKPVTQMARKCGDIPMTEEQQKQLVEIYGKLNEEIDREMASRDVVEIPEMLSFPIIVHVLTNDGRIHIPRSRIWEGLGTLNRVYAKVNIKFSLIKIDSLATSQRLEDFYYGIWNTETDVFFDKYNKENVINLYLLDNAEDGSYLNGFTYPVDLTLPNGRNRDLICIGMRTIDNGKTLVHEMGHFFTLLHTFNVNGCGGGCRTEEAADGSNCSTTGDLICDTPADPADPNYIDVRTCRYYGDLKDDRGRPYNPMINNFMSYYDACCDYQFSPQQYAIIRKVATNYRHYLKRKIAPTPAVTPTTPPVAATTSTTAPKTTVVTTTPKTTVATTPVKTVTTTVKPAAPKPTTVAATKPKVTNPISSQLPNSAEKKLVKTTQTTAAMPAKPTTTVKATTTKPSTVKPK